MSVLAQIAQDIEAADLQNIEAAGGAGMAYGLAAIGPGIGHEMRRDPKRHERIVRRARDAPVGSCLPDLAVQHHALTVECVEGPQAKVTVSAKLAYRDTSVVDTLHQSR